MESILKPILPARALGIEITEWVDGRVELTAPLDRNLNDKGTAFAGSIDALLDLAGWSAITLALHDAGLEAEVMIVKSETEYRAAVRGEMTATAYLSPSERERILKEMESSGKSRVALQCRIVARDTECALMTAEYAVIVKSGTAPETA